MFSMASKINPDYYGAEAGAALDSEFRLDLKDLIDLADLDQAADHPIDRAARQQLRAPARHHPGAVEHAPEAPLSLGLPGSQLFGTAAAGGKLDQMETAFSHWAVPWPARRKKAARGRDARR